MSLRLLEEGEDWMELITHSRRWVFILRFETTHRRHRGRSIALWWTRFL